MSPCARLALVCILPDAWGSLSNSCRAKINFLSKAIGPLAATCPVGCRPGVQTPVLGYLSLCRAGIDFYICAFSSSYLWCGIEGAVTSDSPPPSVSLRGHLMQPIPLQCDPVNKGQWEETRRSQDPVLISLGMPSGHNGQPLASRAAHGSSTKEGLYRGPPLPPSLPPCPPRPPR